MGQAFDREGNVLGEAYGDTKAEVLRQLEKHHPLMAEARIKTLGPESDRDLLPPQPDPLLQFFEYAHLPPHLQEISAPFNTLARAIVDTLPRNAERTVALRKLLESKDCAVRARLAK